MSLFNKITYFLGVLVVVLAWTYLFDKYGLSVRLYVIIGVTIVILLSYYFIFIHSILDTAKKHQYSTNSLRIFYIVLLALVIIAHINWERSPTNSIKEGVIDNAQESPPGTLNDRFSGISNELIDLIKLPKGSVIDFNESYSYDPYFHFTAGTWTSRMNTFGDEGDLFWSESHSVLVYMKVNLLGKITDLEVLSLDPEGFEENVCKKMAELWATLDQYKHIDPRCIDQELLASLWIDASIYTDERFRNKIGHVLRTEKRERMDFHIIHNYHPYYYVGYSLMDNILVYVTGNGVIQISDDKGDFDCNDVIEYDLPSYIYDRSTDSLDCYN